jgi:two-component system sensor histidine kinase CpxA
MQRLYMRIFLSFWLTVTLAGGIMAVLAYINHPPEGMFPDPNFADRAVASYAQDAHRVLDRDGVDGWKRYVQNRRNRNAKMFIIGEDGQPLFPRPMKRNIPALARQVLAEKKLIIKHRNRDVFFAQPFVDHLQRPAVFVVQLRLPPPPGRDRLFRPGSLIFLGVFLLVGGLVCWWLARSLTSPIQTLRNAAQQFATGNLSVRVGDAISGRSEIKELADDFDAMAERIEQQVESQQRLQRDISHELRSPLARLNVALELARQRSGEGAESALDRIEREAERLNEMIGQLLSLNQLETAVVPLDERIDLANLLSELVADANFEAHSRQVRVDVNAFDSLVVKGSEKLLAGAIENILRNAVRYSAENSVVQVTVSPMRDQRVTIVVRDHGPGVPEAAVEKIFQPFYRVDDARERRSGGTGIGLAIADRAIRRHGGTITARNAAGGGLEVVITLPMA